MLVRCLSAIVAKVGLPSGVCVCVCARFFFFCRCQILVYFWRCMPNEAMTTLPQLVTILALAVIATPVTAHTAAAAATERHNVLHIVIDDVCHNTTSSSSPPPQHKVENKHPHPFIVAAVYSCDQILVRMASLIATPQRSTALLQAQALQSLTGPTASKPCAGPRATASSVVAALIDLGHGTLSTASEGCTLSGQACQGSSCNTVL